MCCSREGQQLHVCAVVAMIATELRGGHAGCAVLKGCTTPLSACSRPGNTGVAGAGTCHYLAHAAVGLHARQATALARAVSVRSAWLVMLSSRPHSSTGYACK